VDHIPPVNLYDSYDSSIFIINPKDKASVNFVFSIFDPEKNNFRKKHPAIILINFLDLLLYPPQQAFSSGVNPSQNADSLLFPSSPSSDSIASTDSNPSPPNSDSIVEELLLLFSSPSVSSSYPYLSVACASLKNGYGISFVRSFLLFPSLSIKRRILQMKILQLNKTEEAELEKYKNAAKHRLVFIFVDILFNFLFLFI
jgi:hypothetical protein